MAMTVTYATVNGQLICEDRGGVQTFYTSDTQGSLIQCRDNTGAKVYEAWYWPYGEVRQAVYSKPKANSWGYIGLKGYLTDLQDLLYVRARYYRPSLARWQTVDPIWPRQSAYGYANLMPVMAIDPSGLNTSCESLATTCAEKYACCLRAVGDIVNLVYLLCGLAAGFALGVCIAACVVGGVFTLGLGCLLCLGAAVISIACILAAFAYQQIKEHDCDCKYADCKNPCVVHCPPTPPNYSNPGIPSVPPVNSGFGGKKLNGRGIVYE